jgi:hypothetical protein
LSKATLNSQVECLRVRPEMSHVFLSYTVEPNEGKSKEPVQ